MAIQLHEPKWLRMMPGFILNGTPLHAVPGPCTQSPGQIQSTARQRCKINIGYDIELCKSISADLIVRAGAAGARGPGPAQGPVPRLGLKAAMDGEGDAEEGRREEEERVRVARRARRQHLRRRLYVRRCWQQAGWWRVVRICRESGLRTVFEWGLGWDNDYDDHHNH